MDRQLENKTSSSTNGYRQPEAGGWSSWSGRGLERKEIERDRERESEEHCFLIGFVLGLETEGGS